MLIIHLFQFLYTTEKLKWSELSSRIYCFNKSDSIVTIRYVPRIVQVEIGHQPHVRKGLKYFIFLLDAPKKSLLRQIKLVKQIRKKKSFF